MTFQLPAEIAEFVTKGALFVANHSGGKDSQALLIKLAEVIPARQLLVIHASLGDIEWAGALELARDQAAAAGLEFIVAKPVKTFLEMVEHRFASRPEVPSWPSNTTRQCTSDLKRGPIDREVRRYAKAKGFTTVISCMGIRAAESVSRSKLAPFKANARNTIAGRAWFDWLPIFDLSTADVFAAIIGAGQTPHAAYDFDVATMTTRGNERLSCVFCIMASKADIGNGARKRPDLLAQYVAMEEKTGWTMHASRKPLLQIIAEYEADMVG